MAKVLFLDTETTGLDCNLHGLVQVAGIVEVDGDAVEEFNIKVKPYPLDEVSAEAVKVNGWKADSFGLPPTEGYKKIIGVFNRYIDRYNKQDKFLMVGQNVQFDYGFLERFFKKNRNDYLYSYIHWRKVDLIGISAFMDFCGKVDFNGNYKLESVCKTLGIPITAHDALNDVRAVREVLRRFISLVR